MSEKRILIVDDELLSKIDANRGEMSRTEFLSCILDNQLQEESSLPSSNRYVSREEYAEFVQEMKELLRRLLDFFISYGIKKNDQPEDGHFAELLQKVQSISAQKIKPRSSK
jgi:hypothetical protein